MPDNEFDPSDFIADDQGIVTAADIEVVKRPRLYPVVDAHLHIAASPELYELAVRIMDAAGIAAAVNLEGGDIEKHTEIASRYPGRFVNFCGGWPREYDWDAPDVGDVIAPDIEDSRDRGAAGFGEIVRWSLNHGLAWDAPRLEPMWAKLEELRMPVNIHVGDPPRYWRTPGPLNMLEGPQYSPDKPSLEELLDQEERVLERHPRLVVVAAHTNNLTEDPDRLVRLFEAYPDYHVDLAAICGEWGRVPERFCEIVTKYADRFFFGSDCVFEEGVTETYGGVDETVSAFTAFYLSHFQFLGTDQELIPTPFKGNPGKHLTGRENGFTRYANDGVNLPEEVLRKVYCENAERLFGLSVADWKPPKQPDWAAVEQ
ncbi:MAG: amidohydrolase family protein [Planctomycetota bacterium]